MQLSVDIQSSMMKSSHKESMSQSFQGKTKQVCTQMVSLFRKSCSRKATYDGLETNETTSIESSTGMIVVEIERNTKEYETKQGGQVKKRDQVLIQKPLIQNVQKVGDSQQLDDRQVQFTGVDQGIENVITSSNVQQNQSSHQQQTLSTESQTSIRQIQESSSQTQQIIVSNINNQQQQSSIDQLKQIVVREFLKMNKKSDRMEKNFNRMKKNQFYFMKKLNYLKRQNKRNHQQVIKLNDINTVNLNNVSDDIQNKLQNITVKTDKILLNQLNQENNNKQLQTKLTNHLKSYQQQQIIHLQSNQQQIIQLQSNQQQFINNQISLYQKLSQQTTQKQNNIINEITNSQNKILQKINTNQQSINNQYSLINQLKLSLEEINDKLSFKEISDKKTFKMINDKLSFKEINDKLSFTQLQKLKNQKLKLKQSQVISPQFLIQKLLTNFNFNTNINNVLQNNILINQNIHNVLNLFGIFNKNVDKNGDIDDINNTKKYVKDCRFCQQSNINPIIVNSQSLVHRDYKRETQRLNKLQKQQNKNDNSYNQSICQQYSLMLDQSGIKYQNSKIKYDSNVNINISEDNSNVNININENNYKVIKNQIYQNRDISNCDYQNRDISNCNESIIKHNHNLNDNNSLMQDYDNLTSFLDGIKEQKTQIIKQRYENNDDNKKEIIDVFDNKIIQNKLTKTNRNKILRVNRHFDDDNNIQRQRDNLKLSYVQKDIFNNNKRKVTNKKYLYVKKVYDQNNIKSCQQSKNVIQQRYNYGQIKQSNNKNYIIPDSLNQYKSKQKINQHYEQQHQEQIQQYQSQYNSNYNIQIQSFDNVNQSNIYNIGRQSFDNVNQSNIENKQKVLQKQTDHILNINKNRQKQQNRDRQLKNLIQSKVRQYKVSDQPISQILNQESQSYKNQLRHFYNCQADVGDKGDDDLYCQRSQRNKRNKRNKRNRINRINKRNKSRKQYDNCQQQNSLRQQINQDQRLNLIYKIRQQDDPDDDNSLIYQLIKLQNQYYYIQTQQSYQYYFCNYLNYHNQSQYNQQHTVIQYHQLHTIRQYNQQHTIIQYQQDISQQYLLSTQSSQQINQIDQQSISQLPDYQINPVQISFDHYYYKPLITSKLISQNHLLS